MKITVDRAALRTALARTVRVVLAKGTIPILSNVLLTASGDRLGLEATDLDVALIDSVPAEVAEPGAITVPAQMLAEIVRKMPDGCQIGIELTDTKAGQRLAVRTGRSRFVLNTLPEEDFPHISAAHFSVQFVVGAKDLKRLVDKSQFAISTEETRYYLNGIYLHPAERDGTQVLRAVATDGRRLAQVECAAPAGAERMPSVIVPRKAVTELQRMLADQPEDVTVAVSETKIRFEMGVRSLTSKLVEGTFPDYSRVIPLGNEQKLLVDREQLDRAVDRVSTVASERGRAVKVEPSAGQVTLTVNSPDDGSAVEEVDAEYDGLPLAIGFNSKYLMEILAQVDGDTVELKLADAGSPTLFRDPLVSSALYVLMPMRVL